MGRGYRILDHGHAAGVQHVHRTGDDRPALLRGERGSRVGVGNRDVDGPERGHVQVHLRPQARDDPAQTGRLEIRTEGLWAELLCETPGEHWTLGLEAFGVRLDTVAEAWPPGNGAWVVPLPSGPHPDVARVDLVVDGTNAVWSSATF